MAAETKNPYFLFQLFEKNEKKSVVIAFLLVHTINLQELRFIANEYGLQNAHAADTVSKFY